jgi:hypothetical protein
MHAVKVRSIGNVPTLPWTNRVVVRLAICVRPAKYVSRMTKWQQRELIFNSHYFDCYHLPSIWCIVRIAKLQFPFRKRLSGCDRFCQRQVGDTYSISLTTLLTLPSVALYGLLLFYNLTNDDLRGRRPLAKFLAIKMLVFLTFYQVFLVSTSKTHRTLLYVI